MNKNPVPLHPIAEVIGEEAFAKLQAGFGGTQFYIPPSPASALLNPVLMPSLCLRGTFADHITMNAATQTVAGAAYAMRAHGVRDLVIQVEAAGMGFAYLDRLEELLGRHGIKVQALKTPR